MKNSLILAGILALSITLPTFAQDVNAPDANKPMNIPTMTPLKAPGTVHRMKEKGEFHKRLNLTEEQKAKAKEIREKGRAEMQPIMEDIKAKRDEIQAVKYSKIAKKEQDKKIENLNKDLKKLYKKAHDARVKNMQEFESILTDEQKQELSKMKEEGRKRFEQNRKKPDFAGGYRPLPPKKGGMIDKPMPLPLTPKDYGQEETEAK